MHADINVVRETLRCNYHGTLAATRALLPLIRPGGRLVNVSSMSGHLNSQYSPEIRAAFAASRTVDDVTRLMESFTEAVEQGTEKEQGWPSAAYPVSKSGVTAMTRAVAMEEKEKGRGVLVNSCCPGYVATDMTGRRGAKTVDMGAQTPVLLACGDIGGRTGEFVRYTFLFPLLRPVSFSPSMACLESQDACVCGIIQQSWDSVLDLEDSHADYSSWQWQNEKVNDLGYTLHYVNSRWESNGSGASQQMAVGLSS